MSEFEAISYFDDEDKSWGAYIDGGRFLAHISPLNGIYLDEGKTEVFYKALPFYEDVKILRVDHAIDDLEMVRAFFLKSKDEFFYLDGDVDPILEVNESAPVSLNDENVFEYLKFYCSFLIDEEGEDFFVIEGAKSEFLLNLSAYDKKRILKKFEKPKVFGFDKEGVCTISTRVLYSSAAFDATFEVKRDGAVEMTSDEPV